MAETKIEWADYTFNPWRGCSKVSAGCANCYAEIGAKRNPDIMGVWGPDGTRVVAAEEYWQQPVRWNRAAEAAGERRRVFCASWADVFEEWRGPMLLPNGRRWYVPEEGSKNSERWGFIHDARRRLFRLIDSTPNLDWMLLTKRPENIGRMMPRPVDGGCRKNVWLGASVEDQETADKRVPILLNVPAAVRFLSCEPLLGPINLDAIRMGVRPWREETWLGVDWVIVGGESGQRARPMAIEFARRIVDQCSEAGVPVFVKQMGKLVDVPMGLGQFVAKRVEALGGGRLRLRLVDPKGGDPAAWPADLRIRQFPKVGA